MDSFALKPISLPKWTARQYASS